MAFLLSSEKWSLKRSTRKAASQANAIGASHAAHLLQPPCPIPPHLCTHGMAAALELYFAVPGTALLLWMDALPASLSLRKCNGKPRTGVSFSPESRECDPGTRWIWEAGSVDVEEGSSMEMVCHWDNASFVPFFYSSPSYSKVSWFSKLHFISPLGGFWVSCIKMHLFLRGSVICHSSDVRVNGENT